MLPNQPLFINREETEVVKPDPFIQEVIRKVIEQNDIILKQNQLIVEQLLHPIYIVKSTGIEFDKE